VAVRNGADQLFSVRFSVDGRAPDTIIEKGSQMLIEENEVSADALPVEDFKAHLRLGRGFSGDSVQDAVLDSFLRAALSAIEGRTGKALISRDFVWTSAVWGARGQVFPVAPVTVIAEVAMLDGDGGENVIAPTRYRLDHDTSRSVLRPRGVGLPSVTADGAIRVRFSAGYGPAWSDLPADLAQAVMLLAAHYYEHREATGLGAGCMPFGVTSLLNRYRPMRLSAGGQV